jgi:hypothetical protein
MIHNITWINQNVSIPSLVTSNYIAREVLSKEFEKIVNQEKIDDVKKIRPVEEVSKVKESDNKKHLDLKA